MLLPWLTWAAVLVAASATDATPEELLLLETSNTALPHRLLQLLAETGQLQQRHRRLLQSVGFKPWSGKRSGLLPAVVADEPSSGEATDRLDDWPDKRGSFKPWTGKRGGFKPWVGKRNMFKPWTGKRGSFKPWTGKRGSFKPWTGKRGNFKPWTGKRESFKPWTGKRGSFKPWTGKRDITKSWTGKPTDQDFLEDNTPVESGPHGSDLASVLHTVEDYAKRIAARSSAPAKSQTRHIVRQRFKPWSGKRSAEEDEPTETDDDMQF